MNKKAEIFDFETSTQEGNKEKRVQLDSGRRIHVQCDGQEEIIEIAESNGDILMKVRMTDEGPVISAQGARLELKSSETIALEAKKIRIQAQEEAIVESKGGLDLSASKKMDLHADDDIRIVGEIASITQVQLGQQVLSELPG